MLAAVQEQGAVSGISSSVSSYMAAVTALSFNALSHDVEKLFDFY